MAREAVGKSDKGPWAWCVWDPLWGAGLGRTVGPGMLVWNPNIREACWVVSVSFLPVEVPAGRLDPLCPRHSATTGRAEIRGGSKFHPGDGPWSVGIPCLGPHRVKTHYVLSSGQRLLLLRVSRSNAICQGCSVHSRAALVTKSRETM